MPRAGATAAALALIVAACAPTAADEAEASGGKVSARWEGADSVRVAFDAPGTARWCAGGRWLELAGVLGDTGLMLAVFPAESLVRGSYPIARPVRHDSLQLRPGATLGVRWFVPGLVVGYRGWRGELELTEVGPAGAGSRTVSGRLEAEAVPVTGEGSIVVEGEFSGVPVADADSACGNLLGG